MADPIYCILLIDWPCAKGEVWAAWAQAILSAAAIWYAGQFSREQDRVARKRRLDSIVGLFGLAEDAAEEALARATHQLGCPLAGQPVGFARLSTAFSGVPLHDLPDGGLVSLIDRARECCDEFDALFDKKVGAKHVFAPQDLTQAIHIRDTLVYCSNQAMGLANRATVPLKLWWRIRKIYRSRKKSHLEFIKSH